MAAFMLAETFSLPRTASTIELLTRRSDRPGWLGLVLAAAGVAVLVLA